jgi:hypothetical protein
MAKEIFDQERPRSAMARRLDEAFAGCEQWTLAPPVERDRDTGFRIRRSHATPALDSAPLPFQDPTTL